MAKKSTMSISASNSSSFCLCAAEEGPTGADVMAEVAEIDDGVDIFLVELTLIGIFALEDVNNKLLPLATERSCFDAEGAARSAEEDEEEFINAPPFVVVVATSAVIAAEEDDAGPLDCCCLLSFRNC